MKHFFYVIFVALTISSCQVTNYKSITILEWNKDANGKDIINLIEFDENGNILFNDKNAGSTNMDSLTVDFDKLIKGNKLKRRKASNNAPAEADPPKKGQKRLYITFITLKDFNNEKEFFNKSSTVYSEIIPLGQNYDFFKVLNEKNLGLIKRFLKNK